MATVEILLKATDQASAVLSKVATGAGTLDKKFSSAKDSFKKFGAGINDVVQGMTGMNIAQLSLVGGVTALANGVKNAFRDYNAYVEQIDKISMSTGVAADETSRLLQVGDDFRVEISTMTNAMNMAVQNGFQPTVENMAKLADEYLAIQNPIEQTNLLQRIFGRQWKEVVPLLERGGTAIREAAAGISDGLVVTQDAIEANREYAKAVDDVADAWTAVKNAAVKEQMVGIAGSMSIFAKNLTDLQNGVSIFKVLRENQAAYATLVLSNEPGMKAMGDRYEAMADALKKTADATEQSGEAAQSSSTNWYALAEAQSQAAANTMMQGYMDQTTAAIESQSAALDTLLGKQAAWANSTGGQVSSGLNEAALGSDKYEAALSAIDDTMGTSLRTDHEKQDAIDGLNKDFNSGKISLEAYEAGLLNIKSSFDPFTGQVQNAREQLALLEAQLRGMEGTLSINVSYNGGGGGGDTNRKDEKNGGEVWGATGTMGTVPAKFTNDSFTIHASAGEQYVVAPPGKSVNDMVGAGTTTINIFTSSTPGQIRTALTIAGLMGGAR